MYQKALTVQDLNIYWEELMNLFVKSVKVHEGYFYKEEKVTDTLSFYLIILSHSSNVCNMGDYDFLQKL